MTTRLTPKEIHTNRRNLSKRINNSKTDSFILDGTKDVICNKFGNVNTTDDTSTIIIKGQLYKIEFGPESAVVHTRPIDPFNKN